MLVNIGVFTNPGTRIPNTEAFILHILYNKNTLMLRPAAIYSFVDCVIRNNSRLFKYVIKNTPVFKRIIFGLFAILIT